jgi:hypothetical protein
MFPPYIAPFTYFNRGHQENGRLAVYYILIQMQQRSGSRVAAWFEGELLLLPLPMQNGQCCIRSC